MSLYVETERFTGPLALLLHLIRKEEMDIFDINIHQITTQYLEYIKAMKKLDLELAGEFIAMAATLIQIKSRMLLPQYNEEGEVVAEADPRKELVQRLLEYEKFQEAAQRLNERPLVGRDVWLRGHRENLQTNDEEEILLEDNALFSLISAYRKAVKNMKSAIHRVGSEMQSIAERILELKDHFIVGIKTTFFSLLPDQRSLNQVLVTFLSLLELTRMGFISVFQSENFAEIHIDTKRVIDKDVVSKAESFEAAKTQELAESVKIGNEVAVPDDFDAAEPLNQANEINQAAVVEKLDFQYSMEPMIEDEEQIPVSEIGVDAATDEEIEAEEVLIAKLNEVPDRGQETEV